MFGKLETILLSYPFSDICKSKSIAHLLHSYIIFRTELIRRVISITRKLLAQEALGDQFSENPPLAVFLVLLSHNKLDVQYYRYTFTFFVYGVFGFEGVI